MNFIFFNKLNTAINSAVKGEICGNRSNSLVTFIVDLDSDKIVIIKIKIRRYVK